MLVDENQKEEETLSHRRSLGVCLPVVPFVRCPKPLASDLYLVIAYQYMPFVDCRLAGG